ncbi:MAG: HAD family hydrolase, partial [Desulfovibrio sp.]
VEQALADLDIDLGQSVAIGDKCADVDLGQAVGALGVLVRTGHGAQHEAQGRCTPDLVADDLLGAAKALLAR